MTAAALFLAGPVISLPLLGAAVIAARPARVATGWIAFGASVGAFLLSCRLPGAALQDDVILLDPLAAHMTMLTAFVGATTFWVCRDHTGHDVDRRGGGTRHALALICLGATLAALMANNLGLVWACMEAASGAAALLIGLPRTQPAARAAWRFLIVGGAALALALFGTILLTLAALPVLGPVPAAMSWTGLALAAPAAPASLLSLAFVFLLVGYGTKAGLMPLHTWLPEAHAAGPTPMVAVLTGSVLNVALAVLLRLRAVVAVNTDAIAPGPPLMLLGLLGLVLAGFTLWRRDDARHFFAVSAVGQSGVAAFAFGLGGAAAVFAGVLHVTVHTLARTAISQCLGGAVFRGGGSRFADLARPHLPLALTLGAGIVAVAGLPPFGLFSSEFLIANETVRRLPLLTLPLGLGLALGGWALATRLVALLVAPNSERGPAPNLADLVPAWLHLAGVLLLGLAMPGAVVAWLTTIAAGAS